MTFGIRIARRTETFLVLLLVSTTMAAEPGSSFAPRSFNVFRPARQAALAVASPKNFWSTGRGMPITGCGGTGPRRPSGAPARSAVPQRRRWLVRPQVREVPDHHPNEFTFTVPEACE
jgi:hypothetical protein